MLSKMERVMCPQILDDAARFLVAQEARSGGWPRQKDGPISLYHTAAVVSALAALDPVRYASRIAQAVYAAKDAFGGSPSSLDINTLAWLILIAGAERAPDTRWIAQLGEHLKTRMREGVHNTARINIRRFATGVIALKKVGDAGHDLLEACIARLSEMEEPGAGCWKVGNAGKPNALVTAYVVRTLSEVAPDTAAGAIHRGRRYLEEVVAQHGWHELAVVSDVYAQAIVLGALARGGTLQLIEQGIAVLQDAVNSDGGWGSAAGEPSAIEPTATAMESLLACGVNRFVPSRIAEAAIAEMAARENRLTTDLATLQRDVEDEVARRCGAVLHDRDVLRLEIERLRSTEEKLKQRIEEIHESALEGSRLERRLMHILADVDNLGDRPVSLLPPFSYLRCPAWLRRAFRMVIPSTLIAAGVSMLFVEDALRGELMQVLPIALLFLGLLAVNNAVLEFLESDQMRDQTKRLLNQAFRRDNAAETLDVLPLSGVSAVVREFCDFISRVPSSAREELTYAVITRVKEMPPDVGMRYIFSMLRRLDINEPATRLVVAWVRKFLDLDPFERAAAAEQIGRLTRAI